MAYFPNNYFNPDNSKFSLSDSILKYLTENIADLKLILNEMSEHHMALCLDDTKLANIQMKQQNIPKTYSGNIKFNNINEETRNIFLNIINLKKIINKTMNKHNTIIHAIPQMKNIFIQTSQNENINNNYDNDNDNEHKNIYAEEILFLPQPAPIQNNEIETLSIDLLIKEINTISNLIIEINNKITQVMNNCLITRNNITQRYRERMNIDLVNIIIN
jgi:hypothetical protein